MATATMSPHHANAIPSHGMSSNAQAGHSAYNGAAGPMPSASMGTTQPKARGQRQVGDWVLGKTIGAGSMGKVKVVVHQHTREKCAVKIIPRYTPQTRAASGERFDNEEDAAKAAARDASKETRTIREASISLLLHHPYICGMREMIVHANHYYMVFEFIDGGQMLDYIISHGRLRERAARKFARQIASALVYCHRNSIVHRDLKIENILISKAGNCKIIDFGLSNLFSPYDHLSTFCGSLYFAAPELLNAKVYTGPEVDVWSFGIVLYVLVCGKVPFDDQSMPALHAKIKRGLVEYPAWLSAECKALLCRMLVTDPAQRATMTEVLASPWLNKGYDTQPDTHLIHREPLRVDELDAEVIRGMAGFEFGTADQVEFRLREVLTSNTYRSALSDWEQRRDKMRRDKGWANEASQGNEDALVESSKESFDTDTPLSPSKSATKSKANRRFSGLDFYKKKLFNGNSKGEDEGKQSGGGSRNLGSDNSRYKEPLDPTRGFHPLISIYYLVREKMERERVYGPGRFASSELSLENQQHMLDQFASAPIPNGRQSAQGTFGMQVPRLPIPPSTHIAGTTYDPMPSPGIQLPQPSHQQQVLPRPRSRGESLTPGDAVARNAAVLGAGIMQHPEEDRERSQLDELNRIPGTNQHRRSHSLSQPIPDVPSTTPGQGSGYRNTASGSYGIPARVVQESAPIEVREQDISGRDQSLADAEHLTPRRDSDRPTGSRLLNPMEALSLAEKSNLQRSGSMAQPRTPPKQNTFSSVPQSAPNKRRASAMPQAFDKTPQTPGTPAPVDAKPVYLKGLFSVATTTTKSVSTLQADIARVLDRIGIKHRMSKTGFECVHVPSIDVTSVLSPEALAANTDKPRKPSAGSFTLSGNNGLAPASTYNGHSQPPQPSVAEEDFDAWAYSSSGGAGSALLVKFEISIVKVPWLGLNGVQFRRMGGDGWQYQMLAKRILLEMRL